MCILRLRALGFGEQGTVDGREVDSNGEYFIALDMIAEVDVGVFVYYHVVIVGGIYLRDCNVEFAVIRHGKFVPD